MAITKKHAAKRPVTVCECGDHAWFVATKGVVGLCDPEDAAFVGKWNWCALTRTAHSPVLVRNENSGPFLYLHRELLGTGPTALVDHQNRNGADNRRRNIRECSNAENLRNQSLQRQGKSSRFKGVSFDRSRGKWQAYVNVDGKRSCIGRFASEVEAAAAYDAKAEELHGEFAATNRALGLFTA